MNSEKSTAPSTIHHQSSDFSTAHLVAQPIKNQSTDNDVDSISYISARYSGVFASLLTTHKKNHPLMMMVFFVLGIALMFRLTHH